MAKKNKNMDRKLVSNQKHELAYEAKKLNLKPEDIREAKKIGGRSRKRLETVIKEKGE